MVLTLYTSLLGVGMTGLALQALMGAGHGHQHAHGAPAHAHGATHGSPGHVHHAGAVGGRLGGGARSRGAGKVSAGGSRGRISVWAAFAPLLSLLSPLTFFSLCIGAGATGLILSEHPLPSRLIALGAVAGGFLFYGVLVRPLWSLIFRFASKPSEALEGTVAHEAVAVSRFEGGRGVVQVTIDGQLVRVLAHLEESSGAPAGAVQSGEKLLVISVDGHANSCRVMRI